MGESGHYYDPITGKLVTEVPYAPPRAGTRPPTLRDARKGGYFPSVTTVLGEVDKPGLRIWAVRHVVEVATRVMRRPGEDPQDYVDRIIEEHNKYAEDASERGTEIHAAIAQSLEGARPEVLAYTADTEEVMEGFWPWYKQSGLVCERSEHSFISREHGFAGTMDWVGSYLGQPTIADFKTQDFDVLSKRAGEPGRPPYFYVEQGLQLSGYALGTGMQHCQRLSIVISRMVPGLVALHLWKQDEVQRHDAAFLHLWNFWQTMHNYRPLELDARETLEWRQAQEQLKERNSRMALGARGSALRAQGSSS